MKNVALVLLGAIAWAADSPGPGREPVLKQIRVPHNYYFREMYLPQATSGPGGPAWAPDGGELAFAMQGSLWRTVPGSGAARQVTDGPGYDSQPDWSPDGRFIAYASYRDDQVDLRLLEAATGETRPLVRNGAVNVEPRWSPDGRRIAFVSTADEGRWHVHLVAVENGQAGRVDRISEDRDSNLPRYYYSVFDHDLSPTWSPDGSEILFVSNRGHVWGSGGFWRMKAEEGAPAREIRYEETTWRARPDWARDGKRVVYASYLGRQWHQLWLMTADGGDPFPITYGDFDATSPRWSPDGKRIAYVSNEGGNTSLWTIDIPGGRRQEVEVRERQYKNATGRLRIEVKDTAGRPIPVRVSVTGPDGRSYVPDGALRHADDHYDRRERKLEYGYFHTPGAAEVVVPAGPVVVEITRGLEWKPFRKEIEVRAGAAPDLAISLERLADLPARGVWSGDLHVHMNYGGHYRMDPKRLALQAAAEDVHAVFDLIVNKEQRVPDIAWFTGKPDSVSTAETLLLHSQEYHTSLWGHLGLLGLRDHVLLPPYAAYVNTAAASLYPSNAAVADLARAQGGVVGYVHPFDPPAPDPADTSVPLTNELPVDVALGKVDYYEVVGFSDPRTSAAVWYRLLNCGFRIPAGAGTDAMTNYASLRGPVGMNRVFVKTGGPLDEARFLQGLKAGRTFATNGPLVDLGLRVAGKGATWSEAGDELRLPAGRHRLEARVSLRSIVPVDRLEVVGNGQVVAPVPLAGDRTAAEATIAVPIERSGWYTLRAHAERSRHPVLDVYPFASTSPIYVTVANVPPRSPEDARYFTAWIARLEAAARAHSGWNTDEEKQTVLEQIAAARAVFAERGQPWRPGKD
jgi:Tol biopolymer transport system component